MHETLKSVPYTRNGVSSSTYWGLFNDTTMAIYHALRHRLYYRKRLISTRLMKRFSWLHMRLLNRSAALCFLFVVNKLLLD